MTDTGKIPHRLDADGNKVPRIAIMGEFSAGKSTLCNLLMSGDTLPRKVTATQLAPVWMTHGDGNHMRVQTDGTETAIEIDQLASVPLDDTSYIRLGLPQEIFEFCDLIDFPGISDPNMDPDVWANLLDEADAVIWLTHATQAWRQTEAAVWDIVSEEVQEKSLLLLTRWDKVPSDQDRTRIVRRLERETIGLFKAMLPVSLTDAIASGDDVEAWAQSGGEALMSHLTEMLAELKTDKPAVAKPMQPAVTGAVAETTVPTEPAENLIQISDVGPATTEEVEPVSAAPSEGRVMPRRVRPSAGARSARPTVV